MPRKSQSSKAKIAASRDATVGGDVVGRDKIIQQITIVGQFLDFAQVQGLLPQPSVQADYKSIAEAFEKNISTRMDADLQQATEFAGEILKSVLLDWSQSEIPKPLPFKNILERIPPEICKQLEERGYWSTYALRDARPGHGEFLPLKSLSELWIRQRGTTRGTDWTFGIWKPTGSPYRFAKWRREGHTTGRLHEFRSQDWDIPTTTSDDFRLLMAGLVIDLIRLESTASSDVLFWNGLIDLLATRRTSAEKSEPPKD